MNNLKMEKKLKPGLADHAHMLIKAGISAIPVCGGPAAEIFSAIFTPPLSKRRDKWIEEIAQALKMMDNKIEGFKIENLSKNEMFVTIVMHASQSAIRNHQKVKLEALRNIVLNAALKNDIEEDMQLMFLNFVDFLTPWHLKLLQFYNNPHDWAEKHGVNIQKLITDEHPLEIAFPELKGKKDFYIQLFNDLYSRGLIDSDFVSPQIELLSEEYSKPGISNLGKMFIKFITSPLIDFEK